MNKFLTILAWVFGVLALIRAFACGWAAAEERTVLLKNAYFTATAKAVLILVVCAAWLISN